MKISILFAIFLLSTISFGTESSLWNEYADAPHEIKEILTSKNVNVKIKTKKNRSTAILLEDGNVHVWGNPNYGGLAPNDIPLTRVANIFATGYAFAVICDNGRVYAWGRPEFGGQIPTKIANKILHQNIQEIIANDFAFAIITEDKTALSWGHELYGGNIPPNIQSKLKNVVKIVPNFLRLETSRHLSITKYSNYLVEEPKIYTGFSAILENGDIISWGLGPMFQDKKIVQQTPEKNEGDNNENRKE